MGVHKMSDSQDAAVLKYDKVKILFQIQEETLLTQTLQSPRLRCLRVKYSGFALRFCPS